MATANYNTTYNSAAERGYQTSFQGASTSPRIRHYIGGYVKAYAHLTTVAYEGVYAKNYSHDWAKVYTGYYTKTYVGQYTKTYEGLWTGTYSNQYTKQFAKLWSHQFVKAYHKVWLGQYTAIYVKTYEGQYTKSWTNANAYETQYSGDYTGYFARDGIGSYVGTYVGLYSGKRDYSAQYADSYANSYTKAFDGQYTKQWEGYFDAYYAGTQYSKNFAKTYIGYSESFSTRYEQFAGSRAYADQYAGSRERSFDGSRSYQITATAGYNALQYSKAWYGAYTGSGPSSFFGPRRYYVSYYPYVWYDYEPREWVGAAGTYYGQYAAQYNLVWTGTASPTSIGSYAGPSGSQTLRFWQGAAGPNGTAWEGTEAWYEDFGPIYIPVNYNGWGPQNWAGVYNVQANYTKQWTTATVYSGQYSAQYSDQYGGSRTYYGQYANSFAVENYFVGPTVTVNYTNQYNANYHKQWAGQYEKSYAGFRNHTFSKLWHKVWSGFRRYNGWYEGYFDKAWTSAWTGVYTGLYTGLQTYNGKTTGASFQNIYSGVFEGYYSHQWEGSFDAYYERGYERQFANQYEKAYAGSREHSYEGYYDAQYTGYFDRAYEGNYGNVYTGYYEGQYVGYYSRNYIGYYSKGYTGTYAGPSGSYGGITNYTKSYSGVVPYDTVWVGASEDNIKSGQLATEGIANIKSGGVWKQAKELFVKKNGAWSESKAVYAKKDGVWEIVHIGWERTDININSNKRNFNLHTELVAAGASPGTRPQLVNIYVNSGAVFSTTSTPAMDLTASMGTINIGGTSIKHLVRIFVHPDARIIGASGAAGTTNPSTRTGTSGTDGHDAIKTNAAIELYIENYGIIAGGGGGGGAGGYPVNGSTLIVAGGAGGVGAGFAILNGSDGVDILENDSRINGTNAGVALGIHGGSGGLLGQRGSGAGGYDHPLGNIANPGTLKSQYDLSGDGGLPGSAIVGYDATRVTFINTGKIWGDSKYKFI